MHPEKLERGNILKKQITLRRQYLTDLLMYKNPPPGHLVNYPHFILNNTWENGEQSMKRVVTTDEINTPGCLHPIIQMWGKTLLPALISTLEDNIEKLEKEFSEL